MSVLNRLCLFISKLEIAWIRAYWQGVFFDIVQKSKVTLYLEQ